MTKRKAGRPPNVVPSVEISIQLPIHVKNITDTLLVDPVYNKLFYGVRSRYITALIVKDLRSRGWDIATPGTEFSLTALESETKLNTATSNGGKSDGPEPSSAEDPRGGTVDPRGAQADPRRLEGAEGISRAPDFGEVPQTSTS